MSDENTIEPWSPHKGGLIFAAVWTGLNVMVFIGLAFLALFSSSSTASASKIPGLIKILFIQTVGGTIVSYIIVIAIVRMGTLSIYFHEIGDLKAATLDLMKSNSYYASKESANVMKFRRPLLGVLLPHLVVEFLSGSIRITGPKAALRGIASKLTPERMDFYRIDRIQTGEMTRKN
jgi:hypothetical protein